MSQTVFYSWQSDLPNATNRSFIGKALEDAATAIAADEALNIYPVIDRDTAGIAGAPDITHAIFAKIDSAHAFVADISFINKKRKGIRVTPNPNVLIELGYALNALKSEKVILVFNEASGDINDLPFDLKVRRAIKYRAAETDADKKTERVVLQKNLEVAISAALQNTKLAKVSLFSSASDTIEKGIPNRKLILRNYLKDLFKDLISLAPKKHSDGGTAQDLQDALVKTETKISEFTTICKLAAAMGDEDCLLEIYQSFGSLYVKYDAEYGYQGKISNADFDFFRFIGHEMFVLLAASIIREKKWEQLQELLDETIPVDYIRSTGRPGRVSWDILSLDTPLLVDEAQKLNLLSLHGKILNDRHSGSGELAGQMPMKDFIDADFILYLKIAVEPEETWARWFPRSSVYMKHVPDFLEQAERKKVATKLVALFKLNSIDDLKSVLLEVVSGLGKKIQLSHYPPDLTSQINKIGSRD